MSDHPYLKEKICRRALVEFCLSFKTNLRGNGLNGAVTLLLGLTARFGLEVPWWVAATVAFSLFGIVAAWLAYYSKFTELEDLRSKVNQHRIEVKCDSSIKGCRVASGGDSKYALRLQVVNHGTSPAKGCRGSLIKIERSSCGVIWENESIVLSFSPHENDDCESKDVAAQEYLDVIFLPSSPQQQLRPGTKSHVWRVSPPFHELFRDFGDYQLTIVVSSQAYRLNNTCLFHWDGNAETSFLKLIESTPNVKV